jgi:transposase
MACGQYTREFKLEAVRLIKERGVSVVQAARDLEVGENVLRRSAKEVSGDPQHTFPGQRQIKSEKLERERLRREVTKLKAERDILNKSAAYFARESM